ncbi:C39 family peptidase [Nonomuraea sp. NPDC050556]|uniref:C39 family peptidase n=1 Tax=Nonomuraea sp. NPDC050556 TaxID=3364369 RepID=UPI00379C55B4
MKKLLASAVLTSALIALHPVSAEATPAPAGSTIALTAASPARAEIAIKGVFQATDHWCAPASGAIALRTLGIKVSQTTLARKMRTTKDGTLADNILRVLNAYSKDTGYTYVPAADVYSSKRLGQRIAHSVGTLGKAVPVQVFLDRLPWYRDVDFGRKDVGHVMIVNGYDKRAKTFTVWDPNNYTGDGGEHRITWGQLAKATFSTNPVSGYSRWGLYQPVRK